MFHLLSYYWIPNDVTQNKSMKPENYNGIYLCEYMQALKFKQNISASYLCKEHQSDMILLKCAREKAERS